MTEFIQFAADNLLLFGALIVVLALLLYEPLSRRFHGVGHVSPVEVPKMMSHDGAVVIDVSETGEFEAGHIPEAVNAPLGQFAERLGKLEKYRKRPVILTCAHGNRSMKAAVTLRRHGFESVYHLDGGMRAWQKENLPTVKK